MGEAEVLVCRSPSAWWQRIGTGRRGSLARGSDDGGADGGERHGDEGADDAGDDGADGEREQYGEGM